MALKHLKGFIWFYLQFYCISIVQLSSFDLLFLLNGLMIFLRLAGFLLQSQMACIEQMSFSYKQYIRYVRLPLDQSHDAISLLKSSCDVPAPFRASSVDSDNMENISFLENWHGATLCVNGCNLISSVPKYVSKAFPCVERSSIVIAYVAIINTCYIFKLINLSFPVFFRPKLPKMFQKLIFLNFR